ncbi:MAG: hypothetical protein KBG15_14120 [Kofleriaceae bacterium]|nr:hypothetical protein [Kofleriaceae bacterium]
MMKQYTDNTKPCAAGQAEACAKLAEAQIFFKDSPAEIGKNYGVACSARPANRVTGDAFYCLQAGEYAELPSGAGSAAALSAYADGCSLGNFASCEAARRLDPLNTEHYASQGCTAGHSTSCTILASIYADPQNPQYNVARAKEILVNACRFTNDACAALGKLEVQEATKP